MKLLILFISFVIPIFAFSQDTTWFKNISQLPSRYFENISKETNRLTTSLDKKSKKVLERLQKQEKKLKQRVARIDSVAANNFFSNSSKKYDEMKAILTNGSSANINISGGEYLPYIDSLKGVLLFLEKNRGVLSSFKGEKLEKALAEVRGINDKLQQASSIKEFIIQRQQRLSGLLKNYSGIPHSLQKRWGQYNKEIYYFSQQIREYKNILNDPYKLQKKALTLLNKIPTFQKFMKEHSELAGLFNLPGNYNSTQSLTGLQTRSQVQQIITNQFSGGNLTAGQIFGQQIQRAQSQLETFKEKINALGGKSGDIEMPNFNPNTQHTKTFLQRIEYGTNMQSLKSNRFFPSTSDFSIMIGYRIDDKKIAGIGVGGKVGWGKDINHLNITGQGLSLRSFIDIKIKNSFYASGGFEYNYQKPYTDVQELYDLNSWTKSGLIGMSKIVSVRSKFFKKTKVQLLWDFLNSMEKGPKVSQAFKFRVGYNL